MIRILAVQGYRSLRDLLLPLGQLSVITGANGSGKSSVYRSLRLLADAALNSVVASLAREGGLPSTFWAGPETIPRGVRQGLYGVEPVARRKAASLKLGFGGDTYGYSIDLGYPPPPPPETMFALDPRVKRECIWHGPVYRKASALVDRRNNFVWLATTRDEEPVILTQHLSDTDSMLASVADPQRAPEMLAIREAVRGWRFYDHFRTDSDSPARTAQIGTFAPVLHDDGSNLAAALQTIREIRSDEALTSTIEDAFPGSRLEVEAQHGRFELQLLQKGLLRTLSAAELSDGTLRYLLWAAALLTPRPPELMVLNEPETSLHPDLLPALARLILAAARSTQIIVVSHAPLLIDELMTAPLCTRLHLVKDFGETNLEGATAFSKPKWNWPLR
ncbi:AAA family ATPase [Paludibaculum fermentans]|uniref:AAA family ATPase n=1 Tax=Paludibaculum fermentans TaxID=1473598 RepID=A0A7S7NPU8_PALFE|nr:AAA family ATPase [Paludibaculum fermentans]QOY87572.1 AAA family ATPase [Paludibaculum fermentans]